MPASELQKAIGPPTFERRYARRTSADVACWLYWQQSRSYYVASRSLPARSSPLTSYYCLLNAAKTLLTVKNVPFSDHHGVTGTFDPLSKRVLSNEMIAFKGGGVLPALSRYLERKENWLLNGVH